MKLLDENELTELANEIEASKDSGDEDKEFLNSLEKMAEEVEDEAGKPKWDGPEKKLFGGLQR